jgi:hypothetical protein
MISKNQILKDLIENIKNHTELIKNVGTRYYQYDRGDFIKSLDDDDWDRERYLSDIETLSTEIIQMILFNRIIYLDDDGIDIRTDKVIVEKNKKNFTPFRVKKDSNGKYKFGYVDYEDWEKGMSDVDEKKTIPLMKQKELEWERTSKELRQLISKVQKKIKKEKEQNDITNK